MKVIKENIRLMMEEQGISQSELSRRSGVTKTSLNRYLRGGDMPVTKAKAIAHALGVTLAELAGPDVILSHQERELVECYRAMPVRMRNLMLLSAHVYAELGELPEE